MTSLLYLSISLLIFAASRGNALDFDDIEYGLRSGHMMKMLREMVNQTDADTLNLPANATSIRENITDTFSCENRTYGYYADVDNDCQVFHVCLPTQSTSGRNITYRWSFICPKETMFNQEVLTCTRPRDSIKCEDSPMYYDRNDDMYKTNDTDTQTNNDTQNTQQTSADSTSSADSSSSGMKRTQVKNKRKGSGNRKQNIVMQMREPMKDKRKPTEEPSNDKRKKTAESLKDKREPMLEAIKDMPKEQMSEMQDKPDKPTNDKRPMMETKEPITMNDMVNEAVVYVDKENVEIPVTEEVLKDFEFKDPDHGMLEKDEEMGKARLFGERSLTEKKKNKKRGIFRFKADV